MSETMQHAAADSPRALPPKLNLKRLERIQRWLQYVAGFVLMIFIVLIVTSYVQLRRIRQEIALDSQKLQQQKQTVDQQTQTIEENRKVIESLQTLTLGLQRATLELTEANPKQGQQTKESIEKSIAQTDNAQQLPPRIYVQISREDQRTFAARVARDLQTRGYIVPGIQLVPGKPTPTSRLRYCQTDDVAEDDVDGIIKTLRSIHVFVTAQYLPSCKNVRPRHYEIWFSHDY